MVENVSSPSRCVRFGILVALVSVCLCTLHVAPARAATTYASDGFGRTVANGWGSADVGGPYALSGPAADFDADGAAGTVSVPAPRTSRMALLGAPSARDVDLSFRVRTDKAPTGNGLTAQWVARRAAGGGAHYQGSLGFSASGAAELRVQRVVSGAETLVGQPVAVAGLSHRPGSWYRVRAQAVGSSPTTLRVKAWADGQPEPAGWQYVGTDSQAGLQSAGGVGLRAFVGANATNAPVLFSFDDFLVRSPE